MTFPALAARPAGPVAGPGTPAKERGANMGLIVNRPCPVGIEAGSHLARFVRVEIDRMQAEGRAIPEMCGTCAFREGSYPNGCLTTVADALKCVMEGERFGCHEADRPCGGWAILRAATPRDRDPVEMPWDYSEGV